MVQSLLLGFGFRIVFRYTWLIGVRCAGRRIPFGAPLRLALRGSLRYTCRPLCFILGLSLRWRWYYRLCDVHWYGGWPNLGRLDLCNLSRLRRDLGIGRGKLMCLWRNIRFLKLIG